MLGLGQCKSNNARGSSFVIFVVSLAGHLINALHLFLVILEE